MLHILLRHWLEGLFMNFGGDCLIDITLLTCVVENSRTSCCSRYSSLGLGRPSQGKRLKAQIKLKWNIVGCCECHWIAVAEVRKELQTYVLQLGAYIRLIWLSMELTKLILTSILWKEGVEHYFVKRSILCLRVYPTSFVYSLSFSEFCSGLASSSKVLRLTWCRCLAT